MIENIVSSLSIRLPGCVCGCYKVTACLPASTQQHAFLKPFSSTDNDLNISFSAPAVSPEQSLDFLGLVPSIALSTSLTIEVAGAAK